MSTAPDQSKTFVATPSKYVRNKNILLIALCGIFAFLFVKDGFLAYSKSNDAIVKTVAAKTDIKPEYRPTLEEWPGWDNATREQQNAIHVIVKQYNNESWHNPTDMVFQKSLAIMLVGLTLVAIWWYIHCQKRRATANATTLSPSVGVEIPWAAITKIDNRKWKKSGIVWITYNQNGQSNTAKLDEYHLDNLRPILQTMEEHCPQAELISPPGDEESESAGGKADGKADKAAD